MWGVPKLSRRISTVSAAQADEAVTRQRSKPGERTRTVRRPLAAVVVDGDLQCPQEFLILRGQFNLPYPSPRGFGLSFQFHRFFGFVVLVLFGTLVESDGGFQNQEDVITGAFDLPNRGGYAVGIRERFVDRIPQFLHEIS